MSRTLRIGIHIWPEDPFWVQVREAIRQRAQQRAVDFVSITVNTIDAHSDEEQISFAEEVLAQNLDCLISWRLFERTASRILEADLPVVHLSETTLRHPRSVAPLGLYNVAVMLGEYLVERLKGPGTVLAVGGPAGVGEDGRSRFEGIRDVLQRYPDIRLCHIVSPWRYDQAYPHIAAAMRKLETPIDAIFGFSDSVALAARDAGHELGVIDAQTLVVGVNGDPLALAAIAAGSMAATVQTSAADFGTQALDLAVRGAQGLPLPNHFSYQPRLVTAQNVAEVAVQQLIAMADLPNRLVGYSRQQEQRRLMQLETSLEINRRTGLILDRDHLSHAIADLIRANYGYDEVQIFRWNNQEQALFLEQPDKSVERWTPIRAAISPVLRAAIERNAPIFIPDTRHSHRFAPDPHYPETCSRVAVPIRLGGQIMGLLDLHSYRSTHHSRHELVGLQTLADQLGIAIRNAELYSEAVKARAQAEKADQLKTRLLANVSHELRTPLNIILGYSQTALETTSLSSQAAPPTLYSDLQHIYRSGEHLIRLINDLLDLSRAEIGELDLFPETIATRTFLEEVFRSITDSLSAQAPVMWRLEAPARLPVIQADPVRLRQILLNLLHNARKFTTRGQIVLGAEVMVPHLHIWVSDTGCGIPIELQERIFEPFVTMEDDVRREGVGLGLSITRRLVALHRGSMTLESQLGQGSTFHVYLPLPNLSGRSDAFNITASRPSLLLIADDDRADDVIVDICRLQGLALRRLGPSIDFSALSGEEQPVVLAWNLAQSGADDWAAFQQIRSQPQLCQLPIILYHQEPSDATTPNTGMTSIVLKPLGNTQLLDAMNRLWPKNAAGPILVVDDDPQSHELYRRLIGEHLPHYPLRSAYGGHEALAIIAQETPSLIILDLVMPNMDGFAVLEQLRSAPATRQVPVLVISGHMLSLEDIQRLDQARVIVHSKDVLSDAETMSAVRQALAPDHALPQPTSALVKHAVAYLQQNHACSLSRQEIADAVGVNKDYLTRIFHREMGLSPWEYLNRYRIKRARELLRSTHTSITAIATQVGFTDSAYFSRVFHKAVGCSPREYRERS
ncbi:MAG: substrate-binding domain-containing protein [Chloroflexales bacterium]|nr:substrate-binding domain-containing protein [Chloroflexales bacterium]